MTRKGEITWAVIRRRWPHRVELPRRPADAEPGAVRPAVAHTRSCGQIRACVGHVAVRNQRSRYVRIVLNRTVIQHP
jgi:hypothetical protein